MLMNHFLRLHGLGEEQISGWGRGKREAETDTMIEREREEEKVQ